MNINIKTAIITVILLAVLGLGGAGFLYVKNQSLTKNIGELQSKLKARETEIANLKDEKAGIEQELAVWKATDLDKEAELLRLKLKNAESALAAEEKKAAKLKANLQKTKPYADAIAAVDNFFGRPMTNANLNNINVKIEALHDNLITAEWLQAKEDINVSQNSWGTRGVVHTLFLIVSKIRGLTS